MSPHQFIPIYAWMTQMELSSNQLLIYSVVYNYSTRLQQPLTIGDIAQWVKINQSTIYRAIQPLIERKLIVAERQDGITRYRLGDDSQIAKTDSQIAKTNSQIAKTDSQIAKTHLINITDILQKEQKEENKEEFLNLGGSGGSGSGSDGGGGYDHSGGSGHTDNATPEEHEMTAEEKQEAAVARDRFFERMGALTGNLKAGGREAKQQRQLRDEIQHAPTTPPPSPAAQAQRLLREAYDKGARAAESFDYDAFLPLARQIYARQPELLQECIRGYRDAKK